MIKFLRTIPRHFKTAILSVIRHLAISFSASSVVSITLVLLSAFLMIAGNVSLFADEIESDLSIHAVLDVDVTEQKEIQTIQSQIKQIKGVKKIVYSTPKEELDLYIKEQGEEFSLFKGNENPLTGAFFVTVKKGDQIQSITQEIKKITGIREAVYGGTSVSNLIQLLNAVRFGGMIFIVLLALLALFLISNSIKLTIYTRKVEISIMRNVGATNGYIKVPFMIEGMLIGLIGSIIPCLITYFGYQYLYELLGGQLFSSLFALQPTQPFVLHICMILILSGVIVGFVGSFLSTTKYLRWKR